MLGRHFIREFEPLFRMFNGPVTRSPAQLGAFRSSFEHPFFAAQFGPRPVVDLTEEGNNFILEADLPGVKKGDVEVSVGDNGRSVTIEGKYTRRIPSTDTESKPQGTVYCMMLGRLGLTLSRRSYRVRSFRALVQSHNLVARASG